MKRLAWILLAVFGTAFAQVQPVAFPTLRHHACPCCNGDGSCGMPGCLPPASTRTLPTATQPAGITVTEARRVAEPVRRTAEKFFAAFVEPTAVTAATRAPERVTPAASVPLFAAHCSFLI